MYLKDIISWKPHLKWVMVNEEAIEDFCRNIYREKLPTPAWDTFPFYPLTDKTTVDYFFFANTINFSYFAFPNETKWEIFYKGMFLDGAMALFGSFTRAIEQRTLKLHGDALARMNADSLHEILSGNVEIPMFEHRLKALRDVGEILCDRYDGHFYHILEEGNLNLQKTIALIERDFPPFQDTVYYKNIPLPFQKRLKLALGMIYGRFQGSDWGAFDDVDLLTVFADYKLPQVLRHYNILCYESELAFRVDQCLEIPANSDEEIEIRMATLVAAEEIRKELYEHYERKTQACQIDFLLWDQGQKIDKSKIKPYHRTRTTAY